MSPRQTIARMAPAPHVVPRQACQSNQGKECHGDGEDESLSQKSSTATLPNAGQRTPLSYRLSTTTGTCAGATRSPPMVTRMCTPLSYRVKDHMPLGEASDGVEVLTAQRPARKTLPVGLSRNLDRERHGGAEPSPVVAAQDDVSTSKSCKAAPTRSSRSPSPQCTPTVLVRSWSVERERERCGTAEAIQAVLRVASPSSPAIGRTVRVIRPALRVPARSLTPRGTPHAATRDADRERNGGCAPVTIWRGSDREKPQAAPAPAEAALAPGLLGAVGPASPIAGAGPAAVSAACSPSRVVHGTPRPTEWTEMLEPPQAMGSPSLMPRRRNLAEALMLAATKQRESSRDSNHGIEVPTGCAAACCSPERKQPQPQQLSPQASPLLSTDMRKTLTPMSSRCAGLGLAANFSSRSTLPANFRPAALLAACASHNSVQTHGAACPVQQLPLPSHTASTRVFSPGLSPRTKSRPGHNPTPGHPSPASSLPQASSTPCYPASVLPIAVTTKAQQHSVVIPIDGQLRGSLAPVAISRVGGLVQ